MTQHHYTLLRRVMFVVSFACATALSLRVSDRDMPVVWQVLFAPGVIATVLAGGLHGGASSSTLVLVWSVANGLFWAAVVQVVLVARRRKV